MREIKFKAWNKKDKWMEGGTFGADAFSIPETWTKKNFILLQFTGLKDRNGKEIYEGDILIETEKGGYVRWNNSGYWQLIEVGKIGCPDFNPEKLSVIGDIYSNPELLKQI